MHLLLLLACQPADPKDDTGTETAGDTATDSGGDSDTSGDTSHDSGGETPGYSGGTCPVLQDGVNRGFVSGDQERTFKVILPAEPEGAPVVFAWHWLGGSAREIVSVMDLERWPTEYGFIVVAPDSSGEEDYEWDFLHGPTGNADSRFFDDLVACVDATWHVDRDRLYATGMSAGGLWTTWLTIYKADVLSGTAPLSGGTDIYVSPSDPIPVLLTWGGENDLYNGYSFQDATLTFAAGLEADGHFVALCDHGNGHTIPPEATDYVPRFFADHPRGVDPEPYAGGLPAAFPEWCGLPD